MKKQKKYILCFGDSNTHGYNARTGGRFTEHERWTGILAEELGEDYAVLEEGLSGRTTVFDDPVTEGLSGLDFISVCLRTHKPIDYLIIMLGTNDVKQRFGLTAFNIAEGMERLVLKAKQTQNVFRNQPKILVIAPPPIGKEYADTEVIGTMGAGCAEKSAELAEHYARIAYNQDCDFLDAGKIEGIGMAEYDHMHLHEQGHKALALELAGIIRREIG